jgi:hypothetical protein
MALLLLRHALSISDNEGNDDDASTMFSVSVVGFIFTWMLAIQIVLCADPILCSFFCCELLGFCCRATSWHGYSVFCIAGDKDRYLI